MYERDFTMPSTYRRLTISKDEKATTMHALAAALEYKADQPNAKTIDRIRWKVFQEAADKQSEIPPEEAGFLAVVELEEAIQKWARSTVSRRFTDIFSEMQKRIVYSEVLRSMDIDPEHTWREVADTQEHVRRRDCFAMLAALSCATLFPVVRRKANQQQTIKRLMAEEATHRESEKLHTERLISGTGDDQENRRTVLEIREEIGKLHKKIEEQKKQFLTDSGHTVELLLSAVPTGLCIAGLCGNGLSAGRSRMLLQTFGRGEEFQLSSLLQYCLFPSDIEALATDYMLQLDERYNEAIDRMLVNMVQHHTRER